MVNRVQKQPHTTAMRPWDTELRLLIVGAVIVFLAATAGCKTGSGTGGAAVATPFGPTQNDISGRPSLASMAKEVTQQFHHYTATPEPASAELSEQNYAAIQLAMGQSLELKGDLAGAQSAYEAAVRNDAQSSEAVHGLALVKEKLGQGDEAGELLAQAARLAPEDPEILCDLGYWHSLREQWPEAVRCYLQAIQLKPDFPRAHNNLGIVLAMNGKSQAALQQFTAAGLSQAEAHTNLGFAYMHQQQWQHARQQLESARQLDPKLENAATLAATLENITGESHHHVADVPVQPAPNHSFQEALTQLPPPVEGEQPAQHHCQVTPVSTRDAAGLSLQPAAATEDVRTASSDESDENVATAGRIETEPVAAGHTIVRWYPKETEQHADVPSQTSTKIAIPKGKSDFLRAINRNSH